MGSKSGRAWSTILGLASAPVAIAAGTVRGSYDKLTGKGDFGYGFDKTSNAIIDGAMELGEQEGEALTRAAIGIAGQVVGAKAADHIKHHRPGQ
jgi:hypothetical protein